MASDGHRFIWDEGAKRKIHHRGRKGAQRFIFEEDKYGDNGLRPPFFMTAP
jgi:hypothetical protein